MYPFVYNSVSVSFDEVEGKEGRAEEEQKKRRKKGKVQDA